jgi:hypothetical protein
MIDTYFHFIKKILWQLSLFLIIGIGLLACASKKEADGKALLTNILINGTQNTVYKEVLSVIELERIDQTSFKGKCIDTFIGITAYQFYVNTSAFSSGIYDTETRRTATTSKNCIDLGFRDPGGYVIQSTGGVSFTSYECSAKNTVCNVSALNALLGASNIYPKGSFGSFVF